MAGLEQRLEEWKVYLQEAEYEEAARVDTMSVDELTELLRRVSREVKRREGVYSPNSLEYKSLSEHRKLIEQIQKHLRDAEKENSGLTLPETQREASDDTTGCEEEKVLEDIRCKYQMFLEAKENGDTQVMQRCYKCIADMAKEHLLALNALSIIEMRNGNDRRGISLCRKLCEKGHARAATRLSIYLKYGVKMEKDVQKAREYLDLAVERADERAIMYKGLDLAGGLESCIYEKNYEEAFQVVKQYLENKASLDMTSKFDRCALYYYYYAGAKSGHDMEKEALGYSWKSLIEVEGISAERAMELTGIILEGQGRYEELVQAYLDEGTETAIEKVEELFFHEYFVSRPALRQKLEHYLTQLRDSEDTEPNVRAKLNDWYGWRYETGKDLIEDAATAYAYYGKAAAITGSWSGREKFRNRVLEKLNDKEKIVFLKNVMSEGYLDVAGEIAGLYEEAFLNEEAKEYYRQGAQYATDSKVKKQCMEGYARCKARIDRRRVQIEEAAPSYNQCSRGLVGQKRDGFLRLLDLAKKGNTYAALRFAQTAEQDSYLQDVITEFPSENEIFAYYVKAAEAGEHEAMSRLADIYEYGQLGQRKDMSAAQKWRKKL